MAGRGALPHDGPYPGGLLPHGQTADLKADKEFESFDEIDRNLLRAAGEKVIDLIQGALDGEFTLDGHKADRGGAALAQDGPR